MLPMSSIRIYASKMPFPIQFSYHTWVVTCKNGKQDRFDVFGFKKDGDWQRIGQLYKNFHPTQMGCPILSFGKYRFWHEQLQWKSEMLFELDSQHFPEVDTLIDLLNNIPDHFPYVNKYLMIPGPNSNTFVQWVLDRVAPFQFTLPWRAFGRNYNRK
jgi:Protein of unknown function (DUF3750)